MLAAIIAFHQASPTMAFVKLKCALPPRFFTDYLCLLKVEGRRSPDRRRRLSRATGTTARTHKRITRT
jgi:hypothetical protein